MTARRRARWLALWLGWFCLTAQADGPWDTLDQAALLHAIATVESGGDDRARGPDGEVSRYQLIPAMWRQYAPEEPAAWQDPEVARRVAVAHCEQLWRELPPSRRQLDWLLLAWHRGTPALRRAEWRLDRFTPRQQRYLREAKQAYEEMRP